MNRPDSFFRIQDSIEKSLFSWIGIGCAALAVVQLFLAFPASRTVLLSAVSPMATVSRDAAGPVAHVSLVALDGDGSDATVYVNGDPSGQFINGRASINVRSGDVIRIETSSTTPEEFQVDHNDPRLIMPVAGQVVSTQRGSPGIVGETTFIQ